MAAILKGNMLLSVTKRKRHAMSCHVIQSSWKCTIISEEEERHRRGNQRLSVYCACYKEKGRQVQQLSMFRNGQFK